MRLTLVILIVCLLIPANTYAYDVDDIIRDYLIYRTAHEVFEGIFGQKSPQQYIQGEHQVAINYYLNIPKPFENENNENAEVIDFQEIAYDRYPVISGGSIYNTTLVLPIPEEDEFGELEIQVTYVCPKKPEEVRLSSDLLTHDALPRRVSDKIYVFKLNIAPGLTPGIHSFTVNSSHIETHGGGLFGKRRVTVDDPNSYFVIHFHDRHFIKEIKNKDKQQIAEALKSSSGGIYGTGPYHPVENYDQVVQLNPNSVCEINVEAEEIEEFVPQTLVLQSEHHKPSYSVSDKQISVWIKTPLGISRINYMIYKFDFEEWKIVEDGEIKSYEMGVAENSTQQITLEPKIDHTEHGEYLLLVWSVSKDNQPSKKPTEFGIRITSKEGE